MINYHDCIVIGGGAAGIAASIQLKREGIEPLLLEKNRLGGQANVARSIENYPGAPFGIRGAELMNIFVDNAKKHDVKISIEAVHSVERVDDGFTVQGENGGYACSSLIIACGLVPKQLGIEGEADLAGRRLLYYADPNLHPHESAQVLVVGGGDAAFDQALSFKERAGSVMIAVRGNRPNANERLRAEVNRSGIEVIYGYECVSIAERCESLSVSLHDGNEQTDREFDLVIACVGKERCDNFLSDELKILEVDGLSRAGDCVDGNFRQISIAAGDGISAAMQVCRYLKKRGDLL